MSIVVRYAPVPSSTLEQYDEVMRRLQESGEMPADGFDYHVAFLSDGQLLVSEVWDSQAITRQETDRTNIPVIFIQQYSGNKTE